MASSVREAGDAMFIGQLLDMFGHPMSEAEARAAMRRTLCPLPSVKSGGKRPFRRVYPEVFAAFLRYAMGAADYAEVDEAARRCAEGARS